MDLCRTLGVEGASLAELQTANTEEQLRLVSMAWERELLCRAADLEQVPTLPQLLSEELALPSLIAAHQEELHALQRAAVEAQDRMTRLEADAQQQQQQAGQMCSHWGPIQSNKETAQIDALQADAAEAATLIAPLLDQIVAVQLELDALLRRQQALPGLRAQATAMLDHTAATAVETRDEQDWQYVYAADMAEVRPEDPDTEITARLQAREDAGHFDCDTFVVHVLEESGYDLDAVIEVEGQRTTIRRFVMIHAETILRQEFGIPDGTQESAMNGSEKRQELMALLESDDARMGGVATALTVSGQGTEIQDKNDLRPGDLLQYWKTKGDRPKEAAGHAVVVHRVRTEQGILDESSPAQDAVLRVSGIGVLSAHVERDGQPDVYTKDFVDPDRAYTTWFAVRPAGSPWPVR